MRYRRWNLETFQKQYEAMPAHEKAMENPPLVAGSVVGVLLAIAFVLAQLGVV